jgi:hypothetical protein
MKTVEQARKDAYRRWGKSIIPLGVFPDSVLFVHHVSLTNRERIERGEKPGKFWYEYLEDDSTRNVWGYEIGSI